MRLFFYHLQLQVFNLQQLVGLEMITYILLGSQY